MQCHKCVLDISEKHTASMFSVSESGSDICQSGWRERNMWIIWEIINISFSQQRKHPPASYSVILLLKAVHSSETWNTHLQNGGETKRKLSIYQQSL